ncbi:MAG: hypothetical protein WD470_11180 [Rhodospirillaceae bacterium]
MPVRSLALIGAMLFAMAYAWLDDIPFGSPAAFAVHAPDEPTSPAGAPE